jgi:hypothetical protein
MASSTRWTLGMVAGTLLVAGCASSPSGDPFAGGSSRGRNRPAVRVGLEVVCNQCTISFAVGSERGAARPDRLDQVWSYRLTRYPIGSESVQLTASAGQGRLESVRIFVNGELAAVDVNEADQPRTLLCAATSIPRDPGRTDPAIGCLTQTPVESPERHGGR